MEWRAPLGLATLERHKTVYHLLCKPNTAIMLRTSNVAASRVCARRPAVALQSSPTYLHHGRRPSLLRVAASAGNDEPERDCLSTGCEETDNWNAAHLGSLTQRIHDLKRVSTVHFLEHGYQRSALEVAGPSLESRPELPRPSTTVANTPKDAEAEWMHHHQAHADISRWHEDAWAQLRQAVEGGGAADCI